MAYHYTVTDARGDRRVWVLGQYLQAQSALVQFNVIARKWLGITFCIYDGVPAEAEPNEHYILIEYERSGLMRQRISLLANKPFSKKRGRRGQVPKKAVQERVISKWQRWARARGIVGQGTLDDVLLFSSYLRRDYPRLLLYETSSARLGMLRTWLSDAGLISL
jgi:hypothetical protein